MKHIFIVNPISGKADASATLVPQIIRAAAGLGLDYQVEITKRPFHASELARQYARQGEPVRLYACGGDGTLNEVLCGACSFENAEVACVPCGSGNDFVRNYGGAAPFLDFADQAAGTAVDIDLIDTGKGVAAAICSAGLDAQVAYGIPKFRRLPLCGGQMAYNLSIVQQICGHLGHKMRVETDEKVFEGEYLMAAVCNGQSYGGGYLAAPEAKLDDGWLDVVLVKKVSRLRIAKVVGLYKKGRHIKNGQVQEAVRDIISYTRTRKANIQSLENRPFILNVDGECGPGTSLSAVVAPKAARFVLPASVYRRQPAAAAR